MKLLAREHSTHCRLLFTSSSMDTQNALDLSWFMRLSLESEAVKMNQRTQRARLRQPIPQPSATCTLAILSKLLTPKFYHFLLSQSQSFSARISGYRTCCAQMGKSPVVVQFQVYRYITHFISITYRLVYRFVNLFANKKQPINL